MGGKSCPLYRIEMINQNKMSYDQKSWEEFNKIDEQNIMLSAMYAATTSKLKSKGSNYTPPKKKRKKK